MKCTSLVLHAKNKSSILVVGLFEVKNARVNIVKYITILKLAG